MKRSSGTAARKGALRWIQRAGEIYAKVAGLALATSDLPGPHLA